MELGLIATYSPPSRQNQLQFQRIPLTAPLQYNLILPSGVRITTDILLRVLKHFKQNISFKTTRNYDVQVKIHTC